MKLNNEMIGKVRDFVATNPLKKPIFAKNYHKRFCGIKEVVTFDTLENIMPYKSFLFILKYFCGKDVYRQKVKKQLYEFVK